MDETVRVVLFSGSGYTANAQAAAQVVTIRDDDGVISVQAGMGPRDTTREGNGAFGAAQFRFHRSGWDELAMRRAVTFTLAGSATQSTANANHDYELRINGENTVLTNSVTFEVGQADVLVDVVPRADGVVEPTETVVLILHESWVYKRHAEWNVASVTIEDSGEQNPNPAVWGNLTAFRPNNAHLNWMAVPEDAEDGAGKGAGIRRNGDTDAAGKEDDLIPVQYQISVTQAPAGKEFFLRRTDANIKVWGTSQRADGLIVGDSNDKVLTNLSSVMWAHVEWVSMAAAQTESYLELRVRDQGTTGAGELLDRVRFYPFQSIVVGFVGEFQSPADPTLGMYQMVERLYKRGYDARIFDEDDGGNDLLPGGTPRRWARHEVYQAVTKHGVSEVALIGYSHGGGAVLRLSQQLNTDFNGDGTAGDSMQGHAALVFTAYIDGVRKERAVAETLRPVNSAYHYNIHQRASASVGDFVSGAAVEGAEVNIDVENTAVFAARPDAIHVTHPIWGIADMRDVQDAVLGVKFAPDGLTDLVDSGA